MTASKQRVMTDLIQRQCMLQNNQKWQMSLHCKPYLLFCKRLFLNLVWNQSMVRLIWKFNWRSFADKQNHLKGITSPIIGATPILNILIGIDYADLYCSIQERKGKLGESIARLKPLWRTCIGHINGLLQRSVQTTFTRTCNTKEFE